VELSSSVAHNGDSWLRPHGHQATADTLVSKPRPPLTIPEHNPPLAHSGISLKPQWFIMATLFVISLIASIAMIVETMNWLRLKGPGLPAWFHPLTTLSEWTLALSSLGLFVLAAVTVVRSYRNK